MKKIFMGVLLLALCGMAHAQNRAGNTTINVVSSPKDLPGAGKVILKFTKGQEFEQLRNALLKVAAFTIGGGKEHRVASPSWEENPIEGWVKATYDCLGGRDLVFFLHLKREKEDRWEGTWSFAARKDVAVAFDFSILRETGGEGAFYVVSSGRGEKLALYFQAGAFPEK